MINKTIQEQTIHVLLTILIFSSFLFPALPMVNGLPKIHLTDIILPILCVFMLKKIPIQITIQTKWFLFANALLIAIALASLIVNNHILVLRDDFEVLKMIKFLIVFLFVAMTIHQTDIVKILRIVFVMVLLFNFMHYTNAFDFNHWITRYYGSEIQVETFGINSLGQPDTKRIIGTLGNPNNNAILFLFFVLFFFPESISTKSEKTFFLLAVFGTLACQSRTGFIALGFTLFLGFRIKKHSLKTALLYLLGTIAMYSLLLLMGNYYLNSLAGNIIKQNSVRSRLETWSLMWEMIKQKPILGYSPNKDYFENNISYAESEYFLTTWRYGFSGVLAYILILFSLFYEGFNMRFSKYGFMIAMFTLVIGITSFTNNPLSDGMIYMMFAISAGLFFSQKNNSKIVSA